MAQRYIMMRPVCYPYPSLTAIGTCDTVSIANSYILLVFLMTPHSNASSLSPSTGAANEVFSSALSFFTAAQLFISPGPLPEAKCFQNEKFDFIVVGAGTAGCIVANRLTENKNVKVLLIEAGMDSPVESHVPGFNQFLFNSKFDWRYFTTNDGRTNHAMKDGSVYWSRGKMLGGSSNINAMIYVKGVTHDYQQWYDAGNKDWHPDVVQHYYKKLESFQNQELLRDETIRKEYGIYGPLVVNRFNSTKKEVNEQVVDSWDELGFTKVIDINTAGAIKSGINTVTAANGVRQGSDLAYLYPIKCRRNLKILKNTLVTKVLIDKYNRAIGIQAEKNGEKIEFYARSDVILSAGAINSPQLLMLSGVGAKNHLSSKNITCKVHSPWVGQNLQDHLLVPVTIYGNGPPGPDTASQNFDVITYLYNHSGTLAQSNLREVVAFYSSSKKFTYPEYQNHLSITWKNSTSELRNMKSNVFRYKDAVVNSMADLNKNYTLYEFLFNLLHPESRGNISLKSNDPKEHPLIYPNYFLCPRDLESSVVGIKMLTKIVHTKYFKSINGFLGRIKWPECDPFDLDSEKYWRCICINLVRTVYHPVGTCKMGPDPEDSVVDSHLRVHGVQNLRVIDASIMPTTTSGNTNAPTSMIAERGVDLIKQDHNL